MTKKMIVIVGRTIGQARVLMEAIQAVGVRLDAGPGGNVYLVNWTSDPSKFRGHSRDHLAVLYADELAANESQLLTALAAYPHFTETHEVVTYLGSDGAAPKHPGRKFRG